MRRSRKAKKETQPEPRPDDTQEMFTTGPGQPDGPEETREYETVAVEAEEPVPVDEEPEIEEPEPTEEPEPVEDEESKPGRTSPSTRRNWKRSRTKPGKATVTRIGMRTPTKPS